MASIHQIYMFFTFFSIVLLRLDPLIAENTDISQLKESVALIKTNCQNKFPEVTDDKVKRLHNEAVAEDRATKCYLGCILNMIGIMHKGKFNYEMTKHLIANVMPKTAQAEYQTAVNHCKNVISTDTDPCSLASDIYICFKKQIKHFDLI